MTLKSPVQMADVSSAIEARKPQAKSRVGNGATLLPHCDGRSVWARLMKDSFESLLTHCGGVDHISEPLRMAARRVATLEAELIHLEDSFATTRASGGTPDDASLDLYSRLANTQRRLAEVLGWQRTARNITPDVKTYVREKYGPAAEVAA